MKDSKISVGSRELGKAREIESNIRLAEGVADCITLAQGAPCTDEIVDALGELPSDIQALIAAKFNRAYRIAIQDGHTRPMYEDGERDVTVFQAKIDELQNMPLKSIKARGRPAKAQEVKIEERTYSPAEVAALLGGLKGVKVVK